MSNLHRILSQSDQTIVRQIGILGIGPEFSVEEIKTMIGGASSPEEAEELCAMFEAVNVGSTLPPGGIDNNALAADAMEAAFNIEDLNARKTVQATAVRLRQMDALVRRLAATNEEVLSVLADSARLIDHNILKNEKTD